MSDLDLLAYKFVGTSLFYGLSFLRRPWRVLEMSRNVLQERETTRLEKTLGAYVRRVKQTGPDTRARASPHRAREAPGSCRQPAALTVEGACGSLV